eukprot:181200-Rhodomonas_salina.1
MPNNRSDDGYCDDGQPPYRLPALEDLFKTNTDSGFCPVPPQRTTTAFVFQHDPQLITDLGLYLANPNSKALFSLQRAE